jgi:hypothetical protein
MGQTLVVHEKFFNALNKNIAILKSHNYETPEEFLNAVIKRLNDEFSYLEINNYRFQTDKEKKLYSQYSAFVDGELVPYKEVVVFFTPIDSKMGDVIIEQSLMPAICKKMEKDIAFLTDERYKKIVLLTSKINAENEVPATYNKMQMDVNSLNTFEFDVIPFFPIKNLSTDTKFNSLSEYLDMSDFLQQKSSVNAQVKYLTIDKDVLYGDCDVNQWKGEFPKSFCFRFISAIFSGGNIYKYNVDCVVNKLSRIDNQLANLKKFIDYINNSVIQQVYSVTPVDDNVIECDEDIDDITDIHRKPERGIDNKGRKRFKTQKRIRDSVLEKAEYLCDCNDKKHFYFESVDLHRYVEGHHIIPMNRQEEYYFGKQINLDIPNNIIPLCPNCHCQIHLGSRQARIKIISEIFVRNKAKLLSIDPDLTLSLLSTYYNIGMLEEEETDWMRKAEKIVDEKTKNI